MPFLRAIPERLVVKLLASGSDAVQQRLTFVSRLNGLNHDMEDRL